MSNHVGDPWRLLARQWMPLGRTNSAAIPSGPRRWPLQDLPPHLRPPKRCSTSGPAVLSLDCGDTGNEHDR